MPRREQLVAREAGTCSHIWRRIERESGVYVEIISGVAREPLHLNTASMSCVVVILVNIFSIFVIEKKGCIYMVYEWL